jgi:hypothetical protein
MTDYKQLAEGLYQTLKDVRYFITSDKVQDSALMVVNCAITYYEEATSRGTGRTTALYIKCIAEALENPGKSVEFIDHYPHHNGLSAKSHRERLERIINKLDYDISVDSIRTQVFLINRFGQ